MHSSQSDQFKTVIAMYFKYDVPGTCFQGQSGHNPLKIFRKGAWPGSRDPLNVWALNTNSSETVKATDFVFDMQSVKIHLAEICFLTSTCLFISRNSKIQ